MREQDIATIWAMKLYGGGFARALAEAAFVADDSNLARLRAAFPELWTQYAMMAARVPVQPGEFHAAADVEVPEAPEHSGQCRIYVDGRCNCARGLEVLE